jgi:hypothetical protein
MIEAMIDGGLHQRGVVSVPGDVPDEDSVILKYLRRYPERIDVLKEGGKYDTQDRYALIPRC